MDSLLTLTTSSSSLSSQKLTIAIHVLTGWFHYFFFSSLLSNFFYLEIIVSIYDYIISYIGSVYVLKLYIYLLIYKLFLK